MRQRNDHGYISSFLVVFCAMFGTAGIIFGGIACAIHHVWWAAILIWIVAFFWMWFWCEVD